MRCEHFETLIPLYVGGDLEPLEADSVRQHLNTCAHCRRLNEEFQASHAWLTGFAVPEFDEASFANMRASVFREIERQEKRGSWPTWIDWLLPKWSPREGWGPGLMLASAAVALAITTGLVAVVYRQQTIPVKSGGDVIAGNTNPVKAGSGNEQIGSDSVAPPANNAIRSKRHTFRSKRVDSPLLPPEALNNGGFEQPLEPPVIPEETAEQVATPEQGTATTPVEPVEKEMLRIELQTADPNIRIIWLTPKLDSPSNPKTK